MRAVLTASCAVFGLHSGVSCCLLLQPRLLPLPLPLFAQLPAIELSLRNFLFHLFFPRDCLDDDQLHGGRELDGPSAFNQEALPQDEVTRTATQHGADANGSEVDDVHEERVREDSHGVR